MAIKGRLTNNDTHILSVDAQPNVTATTAPVGSIATMDNGFGVYFKYGTGGTAWDNVQEPWRNIRNFTRLSDTKLDIDYGSSPDEVEILRNGRPIRFRGTATEYFYGLVINSLSKIRTALIFLYSANTAQQTYWGNFTNFASTFAALGIVPPTDTGYTFTCQANNSNDAQEQALMAIEKTGAYTVLFSVYLSGDQLRIYVSNALNEPLPTFPLTISGGDAVTPANYTQFIGTIPELEALYDTDTSILVNITGAPFTTSVDDFLQFAPMSHAIVERYVLSGQYATTASTQLLVDNNQQYPVWMHGNAKLVYGYWEVLTEDTSATYDKLQIYFGFAPVLTTNGGVGKEIKQSAAFIDKTITTADLDVNAYSIGMFANIDFGTDAGGGNQDAADLTIQLVFVKE